MPPSSGATVGIIGGVVRDHAQSPLGRRRAGAMMAWM